MAVQFVQPHRFSAEQYRRMTEIGVVPADTELIDGVVVVGTRPFRFTSEDYFRLGREGILDDGDRVELLDGEVVDMSPVGGRHSRCVSRLIDLIHPRMAGMAELRIQDVLRLTSDYHPHPDAVVYRLQGDGVDEDAQPPVDDVLLVVEVADSSLLYDRTVKMEQYAAAGIPEYWIVDLRRNVVIVSQSPVAGQFMDVQEYGPGETWRSLALGGGVIRVDDIVGKRVAS